MEVDKDGVKKLARNAHCPLVGHSSGVIAVVFSPDGTRVVSGSKNGHVMIWHTETGAEASVLELVRRGW